MQEIRKENNDFLHQIKTKQHKSNILIYIKLAC